METDDMLESPPRSYVKSGLGAAIHFIACHTTDISATFWFFFLRSGWFKNKVYY
jgi:hypothetical protein